MKFGIILVLMMVIIGGFAYAAVPSWADTPELRAATTPEIIAEVIDSVYAEIARLESLLEGHEQPIIIGFFISTLQNRRNLFALITSNSPPGSIYNMINYAKGTVAFSLQSFR